MIDMVEKCREIARELTQDRARILSREQLINLSVVILALAEVVEKTWAMEWILYNSKYFCPYCFFEEKDGHNAKCGLSNALTTCEQRIAEVLDKR